jgi:hypothetical protein
LLLVATALDPSTGDREPRDGLRLRCLRWTRPIAAANLTNARTYQEPTSRSREGPFILVARGRRFSLPPEVPLRSVQAVVKEDVMQISAAFVDADCVEASTRATLLRR